MPVYEYKALTVKGKTKSGIIDASSKKEAKEKIKAQKLYPVDVEISSSKSIEKKGFGFSLQLFSPINKTEFIYAIRQIATLISAGITLSETLATVAQQTKNASLKKIFTQILERVREGASLSDALKEHPRVFSATFCAMVMAGESSGTLELILEQLATFLEQQEEYKKKMRAALVYPVFILLVGVLVLFFLLSFVVPKVVTLFADLNTVLPLPTIILIDVSNFTKKYWWLIIGFAALLFLALRVWRKTEKGRYTFDAFLLKTPMIGDLIIKSTFFKFANTLGTLLKNGVPLVASLDIVKNIISNIVVNAAIDDIKSQVTEGVSLADAMKRYEFIPGSLVQMVSAGEKSGDVEPLLFKIGYSYEREVDSKLQLFASMVEPILILFLGSVVGFVVMAILLPIFEMSQLIK
jgi:general secretion pathway protein F